MSEEREASLHQLYQKCVETFAKFILTSGSGVSDHADLPGMVESYGRTKIWGDQSRAILPENARGSLDDTLRRNADLFKLTGRILGRLSSLLLDGKFLDL
jgi:hypothetical protein